MLTDLRRASVSLISVALAFSALAQPKSAVEFYDTTGTTPVARFGWQGESGTGKFFVDAPPGTEAMSIQNRNLTAAGEVAATRFRGDGSTLAGIGSASIADGGVQTADLQDSAVTSAKIRNGTITDTDIAAGAAIQGTKVQPDFGTASIRTQGNLFLANNAGASHAFALTCTGMPAGGGLVYDQLCLSHSADTILRVFDVPALHDAKVTAMGEWQFRRGNFDTVSATVGLGVLSDERLKCNIATLPGALQKLGHLAGVTYSFRVGELPALRLPEGPQVGMLAQQVEQVLPGAVFTGSDGYKRLDYAKLVPVLVNAVKEQQAQIEEQGRQIAAQGREIAALKERIE